MLQLEHVSLQRVNLEYLGLNLLLIVYQLLVLVNRLSLIKLELVDHLVHLVHLLVEGEFELVRFLISAAQAN